VKLVELRSELVPEAGVADLLSQGHHWLAGREDRAEWTFVWQKLVELRSELVPDAGAADLPSQGHHWLTGREDRAEWAFVWRKLVDLRSELSPEVDPADLLSQGHRWLIGREDRAEWAFVWRKLVDLRSELPPEVDPADLLSQGHRWLTGREDRAEWDKIWEMNFRLACRDAPFLSAGSDWILRHSTLPQAYGIAIQLLSVTEERRSDWTPLPGLITWARNWLTTNPHHPSWTYLWQPLWAIDPSLDTWRLVLSWLSSGRRAKAALHILRQLVRSGEPKIIDELWEWYDASGDSALAVTVWSVLPKPWVVPPG
jgi:hypothetical protein